MTTKASAVAHPIQGLVKYHGLKDEVLRLPYHDSISVCTAPLRTHTTIQFGMPHDEAVVDGRALSGREMKRVNDVVDLLRAEAGVTSGFRMVSRNDFPSNVGLGASASGFAALALAAARSLELEMDLVELSRFARRGAGSASRAVTGGFSRWYAGEDLTSVSRPLPYPADMDLAMVVAVVPAYKLTDEAHRDVTTSPFFRSRLEDVPQALAGMERAVQEGDAEDVGRLAEADTLKLHAVTMTGAQGLIMWRPDTLRVVLEVRSMRREGIPCYFSIDTGATVYVNTVGRSATKVRERIAALGLQTMLCTVGRESRIVDDHLF
ncbi:MAG: homoserine kinase [Methanomassiliicoccales archaeon PtaU1.Bin030]|nr:MAG: homoserine kinase [Methanomassiliicoccales archaeon PtaU1.Bin030]